MLALLHTRPHLGVHARGEAGRPEFTAPTCQAGGLMKITQNDEREELNCGWGAPAGHGSPSPGTAWQSPY